jgi:hypothetical protein
VRSIQPSRNHNGTNHRHAAIRKGRKTHMHKTRLEKAVLRGSGFATAQAVNVEP